MITIKYRGHLKTVMGHGEEKLEAKCVLEVLKKIKAYYGKAAYIQAKRCLILVNDDSIRLHQGLRTKLAPGDTVGFVPVAGGG